MVRGTLPMAAGPHHAAGADPLNPLKVPGSLNPDLTIAQLQEIQTNLQGLLTANERDADKAWTAWGWVGVGSEDLPLSR